MSTSLSETKILVVDDDMDTREILRFLFQQNGAEVSTADSVEPALDIYRTWRPDVIVADIGMPGYDGFALIASIRETDQKIKRFTPVIALTAFASPSDQERALAAGFTAYMAKPFHPAEVFETIAKVLKGQAA